MNLMDCSCKEFTDKLSSTDPFPGGGGAAALAGALGAALGSMAVQLTLAKVKEEDREKRLSGFATQLKALQKELLGLVDEDAAAFEPLSRAYRIPKEDSNRDKIMTEAILTAVIPPILIMKSSCKIIELLEEMYEDIGKYLISDVGCGCILALSALKAASLNVYINTSILKDEMKKEELEYEADSMIEEYTRRANRLSERIVSFIRK